LCTNNVCTGAIDGRDYEAWVKRKSDDMFWMI
jgi:hypothetical protein